MDNNIGKPEKQYAQITAEYREWLEIAIYKTVKEDFEIEKIEELEESYSIYHVKLQDLEFKTAMTDAELQKAAKLTIDILEELKQIANDGEMTAERFDEVAEEEDTLYYTFKIWNEFSNCRLIKIISEIDLICRVDGAWAMIIANPGLIRAIYAVFERLIRNFDDGAMYETSAYFLLRAIMQMNSEEARDKEKLS